MSIKDVSEIFVRNKNGRLMKVEEDKFTRYSFEIWFEYTRHLMSQLKEGTLLAVRNFNSDGKSDHFSVLAVNSVMPVHYAMDPYASGYPGFELEAARNIASDWTSQDDKSNEDTTIIRCNATPTGIEVVQSMTSSIIADDLSLPMLGQEALILTSEAAEEVINLEISSYKKEVFEGGKWIPDSQIPIYVENDGLLRLHFGVFGYTGAGKSNLISTYISNIYKLQGKKGESVKIVLFDLLSEYSTLLVDQIAILDHAFLLGVGDATFPGSVSNYLSGDEKYLDAAAKDIANTSLYPRELSQRKDQFEKVFKSILEAHKLKFFKERLQTLQNLIDDNSEELLKGNLGGFKSSMNQFLANIGRRASMQLTEQVLRSLDKAVDKIITGDLRKNSSYYSQSSLDSQSDEDSDGRIDAGLVNSLIEGIEAGPNKPSTAYSNLSSFRIQIQSALRERESVVEYPPSSLSSIGEIISDLNDRGHSSLYVIQSNDPDALRDLSSYIGNILFDVRRTKGITMPIVSFVFDEADEFIPGDQSLSRSYQKSVDIAEMLARRGRKYGLGIGICTQRTTYLKTSVMAQPHTYLVSKLPRATDRQRVTEAFGLSEEIFNQTFRFRAGDWLLTSTDATGLRGVPIPIHTADANERIVKYLDSAKEHGE